MSRRRDQDIVRALVLVAVLALWNYASDLLSEHYHRDAQPLSSPGRLGGILLGAAITCGGVVGLGCVVWGKQSLRDLGWRGERPLALVGVALVQTALLVGTVYAAYGAMAGVAGMKGLTEAIASMPVGRRIFFLVMGAKVAFVEETLFRGDLLKALRGRVGVGAAILLSSAAFALFHRTLSPLPLFMKFVFGVVFATATVRSKSVWPAAIAHTLLWAIVADN